MEAGLIFLIVILAIVVPFLLFFIGDIISQRRKRKKDKESQGLHEILEKSQEDLDKTKLEK